MWSLTGAATDVPTEGAPRPGHLPPERGLLHWLFEASLLLKGIFAAIESLAGLALMLTRHETIMAAIDWLTRAELLEDPKGPLIARIVRAASHFDASAQHFYAVYLLGHGLVKLVIVILLARHITLAYPIGMAVFAGFVAYQLHRYSLTHSTTMLALSALDAVVILLTWREWRLGTQPEAARNG